ECRRVLSRSSVCVCVCVCVSRTVSGESNRWQSTPSITSLSFTLSLPLSPPLLSLFPVLLSAPPLSPSCSDEDEELYERLCGEQWRVECVAQLLGEMKDSDLPANFFLQLLLESNFVCCVQMLMLNADTLHK